MVIFNFTKIVSLSAFNFQYTSEHCAVTSELSVLVDWPIVHRYDDSPSMLGLISPKNDQSKKNISCLLFFIFKLKQTTLIPRFMY